MTHLLAYATLTSAIVAVVLAVARDVPILHLALPPDTPLLQWSGVLVCPLIIAAVALGAPWLQAAGWIAGIGYFWAVAAWHLRERR